MDEIASDDEADQQSELEFKSNHEACLAAMSGCGLVADARAVLAVDFGEVQTRERLWYLALKSSKIISWLRARNKLDDAGDGVLGKDGRSAKSAHRYVSIWHEVKNCRSGK